MKIAFLGLGKMGQRMVEKLLSAGHEVIVWNRTQEVISNFKLLISKKIPNAKLSNAETLEDLVSKLDTPQKIFWLMLPAGSPTQSVLDEIEKFIKPGDLVINGANENPTQSQILNDQLKMLNINYLGIGVSGGVNGLKNGFSLMAGGNKEAYEIITPILKSLSMPDASFNYFGEGGAGHFIKMVHNGIEYGMMQAIAEGFAVIEKSDYKFNLAEVAETWQRGTIISSFLIDMLATSLKKDQKLSTFFGPVAQSGEALWTIDAAKKEKVAVPVIKKALDYRLETEKNKTFQKLFTAKVLNALRFAFGGHEIKK